MRCGSPRTTGINSLEYLTHRSYNKIKFFRSFFIPIHQVTKIGTISENAHVPILSIVIPVYNGEPFLYQLVSEIEAVLSDKLDKLELILVEDRGPDASWSIIRQITNSKSWVKGIRLSRNFGQHFAITAGLEASSGEHVIVMDCDMQDDPKYLGQLYAKALEGFDIVYTIKRSRAHSKFKNLCATFFYRIFNWLCSNGLAKADSRVGSYSILSRKVVEEFLKINDTHRHYLLLLSWLGFQSTSIQIDHLERKKGKSSYNLRKLIYLAVDGITSQSDRLLYFSIVIGFVFFLFATVAGSTIIVLYFVHGFKEGWASQIVTLYFIGSLILMALGINSIYLGKTFEQSKSRPLYIIQETLNL